MQHVDHSAGELIDLLQGLLRYDPAERLKAHEALQHPFFIRGVRRYVWALWTLGSSSSFCLSVEKQSNVAKIKDHNTDC